MSTYDQGAKDYLAGTIKQMLTTPLFLTGAISYSVYALFSMIGGIAGGGVNSSLLQSILNQSEMYDTDFAYMQAYMSGYRIGWTFIILIFSIPVLCITAGMWMTYVSARNKNQAGMNVTGLTMIRVVVLIQLVIVCLQTVLVVGLCLIAMVGANSISGYYRDIRTTLSALLAVVMVFMIGYAVVVVLYYLKLGKMINKMKEMLLTGRADNYVSKYVEIFCYINGGVAIISGVLSLVGLSIYGFLSNAGLATANICFALYLSKYRKMMETMSGSQQPQCVLMLQQPIYSKEPQQPVQQEVPSQAVSADTEVLSYYNETAVLSGQLMNNGRTQLVCMTRLRTGETFCISKPNFWIGKDAANVDYCITNNGAISRRHMLVTIQNGQCYIRDNNSTNKVFLNGRMLTPQEDVCVSNGDRIKLGDEEFTVDIS